MKLWRDMIDPNLQSCAGLLFVYVLGEQVVFILLGCYDYYHY